MMVKRISIIMITGCMVSMLLVCCRRGKTGTPYPNKVPETIITYGPVPNDSLHSLTKGDSLPCYFALQQICWDGDDGDGYVVRYKYRYRTIHKARGDTYYFPAEDEWAETTGTEITIPFESSDEDLITEDGDTISRNLQIFEVAAIDNEGAVDTSPAVLMFWTLANKLPETEIIYPVEGDTFLALTYTTATWRGIKVSWRATDPDGEVMDYRWRVDSLVWSHWIMDTSIYIPPTAFKEPLEGRHTIEVVARDNTFNEDPTPAFIHIYLVEVTFDKPLLVVDETRRVVGAEGVYDDSAFYKEILDEILGETCYDVLDWETFDGDLLSTIGEYKMVFWYDDDWSYGTEFWSPAVMDAITQYLEVGGKLWITGWRMFERADTSLFAEDGFIHDYFYITGSTVIPEYEFKGAIGVGGWPSVDVDTNRTWRHQYLRTISWVSIVPFTPVYGVLTFNPVSDTTLIGKPVGIYYDGITYDVMVTTFPIIFTHKEQAKELIEYVLEIFGML